MSNTTLNNKTASINPIYNIFKVFLLVFALSISGYYILYYAIGNGVALLPIDLILITADEYATFGLIFFSVISFVAVLLMYIRAKTSIKGTKIRQTYWGFFLAALFYFLGEFTYYIQAVTLEEIAYPSISDFFWAIGTILLIEELISVVSVIDVKYTKRQIILILTLTALAIITLIAFAFWDLITSGYEIDPDYLYTPFMKAMDIFYFTGDALILFACIYIGFGVFSISEGKFERNEIAWAFLIIGNVAMIAGDTLYSYFEWKGTDLVLTFFDTTVLYLANNDYRVDDMLYLMQYLFWVLSFALFPDYLKKEEQNQSKKGDLAKSVEENPVETKMESHSEKIESENNKEPIIEKNEESTLNDDQDHNLKDETKESM